jgi:hypothetical protein
VLVERGSDVQEEPHGDGHEGEGVEEPAYHQCTCTKIRTVVVFQRTWQYYRREEQTLQNNK